MGQTTLILMIITVISKIFGFVRESVMAAYIGAGELKSIYTTAMSIPAVFTGIIVAGIKSAYIPVYSKVKNEKGEIQANKFTSNLLNILMVYGGISAILAFIFAKPISLLLSPDLSGESLALTANFTRIISMSIFPFLYSSVIDGLLNIKGNFFDPVIIEYIKNIIIVASIIWYSKNSNPYIIAVGTLIALYLQFIRYPFASRKIGFTHTKEINFKDPYIKYLMYMVVPIMFSSAANHLVLLVDNSMASAFFGVDSISKIFYAKVMLGFISGVISLSISTVTFPEIAKIGQSGDKEKMSKSINSAIILSMVLVVPSIFGMMALSNPIIKLAFERNAFTAYDTRIVAQLVVSYGPYIIFITIQQLLSNAFYSVGDSKTPVVVTLILQAINILFNIILSKFFGLNGLAYSTVFANVVGSILMLYLFKKRFGKAFYAASILSIIKTVILSVIISIVAIFMYNKLISTHTLITSLFVSVLVAILIYIFGIVIVGIPEVSEIVKEAKIKINNNKDNI